MPDNDDKEPRHPLEQIIARRKKADLQQAQKEAAATKSVADKLAKTTAIWPQVEKLLLEEIGTANKLLKEMSCEYRFERRPQPGPDAVATGTLQLLSSKRGTPVTCEVVVLKNGTISCSYKITTETGSKPTDTETLNINTVTSKEWRDLLSHYVDVAYNGPAHS